MASRFFKQKWTSRQFLWRFIAFILLCFILALACAAAGIPFWGYVGIALILLFVFMLGALGGIRN